MKQSSKGFTLIELLVVVAIIGLLAATILASLGTARAKAKESKIKSEMASLRSQMELYAGTNSGYGLSNGDCTVGPFGVSDPDNASQLIQGIMKDRFGTTATYAMSCTATPDAWAVAIPLFDGKSIWCVDSLGVSKFGTLQDGITQDNRANWVISNGVDKHCW